MSSSPLMAALRRHLSGPEDRPHVDLAGGIRFEDGGQSFVARDEQVLAVMADLLLDATSERRGALGRPE